MVNQLKCTRSSVQAPPSSHHWRRMQSRTQIRSRPSSLGGVAKRLLAGEKDPVKSIGAFWSPLPGPVLGFLFEDPGSAAAGVIFRFPLPFSAAEGPIFGHVGEVDTRNRAAEKTILRARRRHFFSSYTTIAFLVLQRSV